jgi:hypothetical protein
VGERRTIIIIATTVILAVGLLMVWAFAPGEQSTAAAVSEVTDHAALQKLQISGVGIATSESYVGHRIRVINATLTNTSDQPLRLAEVKLTFHDYDKKPIQVNTQRVFEPGQKPLAPGGKYRFEVNFENLPKTWNYHIPDIEVIKAGY